MDNDAGSRCRLKSVRICCRTTANSSLEAALQRQGSHRLETRRPGQHDCGGRPHSNAWRHGLLYWTGGKLSNCRIRVVYKMRDFNDNSGVFIRIPLEPREEWMPV